MRLAKQDIVTHAAAAAAAVTERKGREGRKGGYVRGRGREEERGGRTA